jgi:wyosine [tRNA(Phe)-imidazoG37] synthetase (radical SAM superfamily)
MKTVAPQTPLQGPSIMSEHALPITFGPVPSRRLGQSLGINNVRGKTCSYSCVYCQVGLTRGKQIEPRAIFSTRDVVQAVGLQLERLGDQRVDYLTFVPDGEPTLDLRLGESIEALRTFGIPVAVISNATLLWRAEVRDRLQGADLVSVKVDSVDETAWRRINRPHRELELPRILDGIERFAGEFRGELISETMLLDALNDTDAALRGIADFLAGLEPRPAYLAVPTRPPAFEGLRGAHPERLLAAHRVLSARWPQVELLTGQETGEFAYTGDARKDLLAISTVHPMREAAIRSLLYRDGADWSVVEELLSSGRLHVVEYAGECFFLCSPAQVMDRAGSSGRTAQ